MQLAKLAESLGLPEEAETLEDDIEACQTAGISAHMKQVALLIVNVLDRHFLQQEVHQNCGLVVVASMEQ